MPAFAFLVESYATERLKTLTVWSQIPDERMRFRPEPRARSPLEHMVHQCLSEHGWMSSMLGIDVSRQALPASERRIDFIEHYAACSAERLEALSNKTDVWFSEDTKFFDLVRSRAWVLTRRMTHSAHHRGQLTVYLRLWRQPLYSTYGPTADTGGLPKDGAVVIYPYDSPDELVAGQREGRVSRALPGPGTAPVTERPE